MARSTSDEEVQLKKRARRRLVGAVVLATAVAVVLPMVLDTEPKPVSQNVNIQIPSPDSPAYAPKSSVPAEVDSGKDPVTAGPSAAAAKPEPAPAAKSPPVPADIKEALPPLANLQPPEPQKAAESPKAAAKEAARPAAKEPAKAAAKDATKDPAKGSVKAVPNGKFVVQVAALADTAKAKQLQQRVAGAGVKAYTEVVKTSKGNVTRVRAGPYETREAAEKARGRLKSAGLDGKVVPR